MIRLMIGVIILLALGIALVPVGVSAKSTGVHQFTHHPIHAGPKRHHRRQNRVILFAPPYYAYDDYGYAETAPPPPPSPPHEKSVSENRHGCESQTYTVPTSTGGESQVTVIRC